MSDWGVWSDAAGGFIETQTWSPTAAEEARRVWIVKGEDADDLSVLPICPQHEEQPRDTCEEC